MRFNVSRGYYKIKVCIKVWFFIFVVWINNEKTCRVLLFDKYGFIYHLKHGGIRFGFEYYDWHSYYSIKKMTPKQRLEFKKHLDDLSKFLKEKHIPGKDEG